MKYYLSRNRKKRIMSSNYNERIRNKLMEMAKKQIEKMIKETEQGNQKHEHPSWEIRGTNSEPQNEDDYKKAVELQHQKMNALYDKILKNSQTVPTSSYSYTVKDLAGTMGINIQTGRIDSIENDEVVENKSALTEEEPSDELVEDEEELSGPWDFEDEPKQPRKVTFKPNRRQGAPPVYDRHNSQEEEKFEFLGRIDDMKKRDALRKAIDKSKA